MTNEEMRKTMEFILEQQAQFAVNIQRLQQEQLRDRPRLARLEDSFKLLVELAETSDTRMDATDTHLNTLEINMAKLEANMATLAESQAHSVAKLSALIDIVREDRNGRS
jgi:chromosome segregation ATPase